MKFKFKIQVIYLFIAFSAGVMLILFNPIVGEFVYTKGQVEYYRMFQFWGCWDTIGEGPTNGMDPNDIVRDVEALGLGGQRSKTPPKSKSTRLQPGRSASE